MGTYTKSWTNRAARPRSERLRRIGGFAGSVLASASAGPDIPSSAPDWFLPMTLGEETYLLLNPKYVGLAADGWLASGGVGSGGGGGGLITSVKGVADLNTPIASESLTETFSAYAIQSIYNSVRLKSAVALSNVLPYASGRVRVATLTIDGTNHDIYAPEPTGGGGVETETDPIFSASAAFGISTTDIANWNAKYDKPSGGIPKTDLASAVQTSLGKADTALQSETDPVYSAWIGTSRTKNTVFAAPSNANGTPSFRALVASDIPSLTISKISDAETWISGKGYALTSDLTALAGRVTSIEDWFEIVTVNGQAALHVKQGRALYADSWIASGGVGSGSGGSGTMVVWGTKSGYTRPLTVEGVTETLLLDGALSGYATTSAMNTALSGKQDKYGFTIQGTSGATYNLANFLTASALNGYVTLSGNQTISGDKGFSGSIYGDLGGRQYWGIDNDGSAFFDSISVGGSQIDFSSFALKAGGSDYNFKVDSLIVSDGGTLDGTTYNGKPALRFSYRYTDESSMTPTIVSETKYLAYKDEIPTDYVKTSGAQQVSGVKTFLANVRGGSSASVNWQITTAGAATFASLTVGGNAVTPSNYVTLDGAQTITGAKTFSAQMTASGGIVTGNDIRPSANLGASLGNGDYRFSGLSVNTISSAAYYFRDSAWSSIAHYAGGFDDGLGYMCIYLDSDPSNQNPPQNPHYYFFGSGSFQGRGGTKNLGSSGVPWGDFYIAYNKAVKSKDTNGNVRDLMKLANDDGLYIGNSGLSRVQLNSTGYIFMYWGSGDSYATFGAGANVYVPNVLPNGTSGSKLLGSSGWRWSGIYGVNADLSGNLSLSSTSHIDIGPLRIEYDATNKALHITKKDSNDTETYGLYADGFIATGGVQQTS